MTQILEPQTLEQAPSAATLGARGLTLTQGQQDALTGFTAFLMDPLAPVFVIEGYAGVGKSTLVETILERLPNLQKMAKLMSPEYVEYPVELTATTNKAAENFERITGRPVVTIQSFLGLRVQTDYRSGETTLVASNKAIPSNALVFIDEAGCMDPFLLEQCFKRTFKCKLVMMGDPAQLTPVKYNHTPVFSAGFPTVRLTEVMRQAKGNPILDLATKFREAVETGQFFSFKPDGHHIKHMNRNDFNDAVLAEFSRPDWKYQDSKFLAWTNKTVIDYNHAIRDKVAGNPEFQAGDYAVCNKFISQQKKSYKTDQLVLISYVSDVHDSYGTSGRTYTIDGIDFFMPLSLQAWKTTVNKLRAFEDSTALQHIERNWIDLRAAYGQTINKSQGSTYDLVFIDLDDIKKCNMGNTIARMMYVGVSRARHHVILTGDLV